MKIVLLILLFAFLITPIAAGHGLAPIGLIMAFSFLGESTYWASTSVLGFLATIVVLVGIYVRQQYRIPLGIVSVVCVEGAWLSFAVVASEGEAGFIGQLILSVVLQAVAFVLIGMMSVEIRKSGIEN